MARSDMLYTKTTRLAMSICYEAHAGQLDKAGVPYVFHPIHLAEQMHDEHSTCVALLHDVMEDTDMTPDDLVSAGIPKAYVETLLLLTHEPGTPYLGYIQRLEPDPVARRVKAADIRHNMDLTRLDHAPTKRDLSRVARYRKALDILEGTDD